MRNSGLLGGAGLLLVFALLGSQPAALGGAQVPVRPAAGVDAAARPGAAAMRGTVEQYCLGCHNDRVKSGGFALDPATLGNVGAHAAEWEKVVRKLRSQAMPPPGMPRPDEATYTALVAALEHDLDTAAAASPTRGQLPPVRRLSRTEYANAVRDLLALEALPREIDISYLLPQDNISSGFDNIADLLFMSPSTLERYLDAARKISRFAVGNPDMPVLVNIHRLDEEHPQDERVDELPFGTRGGIAVRSDFPVTGTYIVKVDLAGAAREPHELEISLDGERVHLRPIAQPDAGGAAGRRAAPTPALEFAIAVEAGSHLVGATFVQHSEARDEATLRPRMRTRGTQPAIASVTITGPQPGGRTVDSPSRQRLFVCRPAAGATSSAERACAATVLSSLARRAYRRPTTPQDLDELLPFYEAGRAERDFDLGIERALQRVLVSPHFLFRVEQPVAGANGEGRLRPRPGEPALVLPLEQHPR